MINFSTFILFLDIDGVMNGANEDTPEKQTGIDDQFIFRLNTILTTIKLNYNYDIYIVVTSLWRERAVEILLKKMPKWDIMPLPRYEDINSHNQRGDEINRFLSELLIYDNLKYLIIDDEDFDLTKFYESNTLYITDSYTGITNEDVVKIIHKVKYER